MKRCFRIVVGLCVGIAVLRGAVLCPPAYAIEFSFGQLDWLDNTGGYANQNSDWGTVHLDFSSLDVDLLTADGSGGYFGFANLVVTVPGGGINNWAVQNMPLLFDNFGDLDAQLPYTAHFSLGTPSGLNVSSLDYYFTISAAPLALAPTGSMTTITVADEPFLIGEQQDPDFAGGEGGLPARNYRGFAPGTTIGNRAGLRGPEAAVPAIDEAVNGCAPAAAARSIGFLGNIGALTVTQSAQQIYGALTNAMQSSTGSNSFGTLMVGAGGVISNGNFTLGKNAFVATNGLQLAPTLNTNSFSAAMNALTRTNDVEMWVYWGYTNFFDTVGLTNIRHHLGGHAVFVSYIAEVRHTNGALLGYAVRYIDDPHQGTNGAQNQARHLFFDHQGNLVQFTNTVLGPLAVPVGGINAGLVSFFIEQVIPEPSVFGMVAIGASLLAMLRRRRSH